VELAIEGVTVIAKSGEGGGREGGDFIPFLNQREEVDGQTGKVREKRGGIQSRKGEKMSPSGREGGTFDGEQTGGAIHDVGKGKRPGTLKGRGGNE